ncbi:MAG: 1-acyl-sn-glycerol-3-phosphate acyltransferase [Candidatus Paralactobacillus gallistercoris]|uniref:1-acyl-sn-glycerol-3-phosphate acyltransferase n=1 Tax=Candidatus Paralactobacillus gallistercoris TaxID=2838724 RepID=A0A948TK91_9LACO|nr:1-acyl-sn-glycerol-3-phosphate acyltransferase [Candidatus Paralactobacillus gallistercoris]
MIIGGDKEPVIRNIQEATVRHDYNAKVELHDPVMNEQQRQVVLNNYLRNRNKINYKIKNVIARDITDTVTTYMSPHTQIIGLDNIKNINTGAIITSNHFNPLDNIAIRKMTKAVGHKRLYIVIQDTNLKMKGLIGFLMNYDDTLPISLSTNYMGRQFPQLLQAVLNDKQYVLIYPEQEMWFNYRKPRPLKRGPYYYAARFHVPIISCFVEIKTLPQKDNDEFYQTAYITHVLPTIYPDAQQSIKANSIRMMQQDYQQKKQAYEQAYHQKLTYEFTPDDIAGWIH